MIIIFSLNNHQVSIQRVIQVEVAVRVRRSGLLSVDDDDGWWGLRWWCQGCQMEKFDPFLSFDCARAEGMGAQSKERKGSNFAAQRSGAIAQKPGGPNTYDLKIWL